MSEPGLQRRVTILENDVESIYELIDDFRTETRGRFDSLESSVAQHTTQLGEIDTRLGGIESTLTEVLRRLPETPLSERLGEQAQSRSLAARIADTMPAMA